MTAESFGSAEDQAGDGLEEAQQVHFEKRATDEQFGASAARIYAQRSQVYDAMANAGALAKEA